MTILYNYIYTATKNICTATKNIYTATKNICMATKNIYTETKSIYVANKNIYTATKNIYTATKIYIPHRKIYQYISGWIFQKVLAEIVQKSLILSQKALISNRRNFGLFAPKSTRFPSKNSNSQTFLPTIFPFSQNALQRLYCSVILTAGFRSVFVSLLRNTQVLSLVSGLN